MLSPKGVFFDLFFAYIAAIVVVLSFIDWLIGKKGRTKIKEKLEHFWLVLDEWKVRALIVGISNQVGNILKKIFALDKSLCNKLKRSINLFFVLPTAITTFIDITAYERYPKPIYLVIGLLFTGLYCSFFMAVGTHALIRTTLYFFNRMKVSSSTFKIFLMIFYNLVLCIMALVFFISIFYITNYVITAFVNQYALITGLSEVEKFNFINAIGGAFLIEGFFLFLFTLLAIIITPAILIFLFGVQLFSPILKPMLSIITLRFSESEKGVLTQLALGLGALAKVIQEILKSF